MFKNAGSVTDNVHSFPRVMNTKEIVPRVVGKFNITDWL